MAPPNKRNKGRRQSNADKFKTMARRIEAIAANTVKPRSGYIPRLKSIPHSSVHMIRNRVEIVLHVASKQALTTFIDEKDDFDGKFYVGTEWQPLSNGKYFISYVGMNALSQMAISKFHHINYMNPENQKLLSYERGLVALQKISLVLPYQRSDFHPEEGLIAYKFSDGVAANAAHIEATEKGTGKLPIATLRIPQLDWIRLSSWKDLTYKPTLKIVIEMNKLLKNMSGDQGFKPDNVVIGYLDVTTAYKYDDVFFTSDSVELKSLTIDVPTNSTDFITRFGNLMGAGF